MDLRRRPAHDVTDTSGWSLRLSLVVLAVTTAVTALISEILVHSLQAFAEAAHLSDFFIAIVIVAIVGNAAEHGGAVVIARRGKMELATEIAISSSAQVGLLVVPIVTLVSFGFAHPLALAFRPIELVAMGAAAALRRLRDPRRTGQTLGGRPADRRLRRLRALVPGRRRARNGRLTAPSNGR